MRGRKGLFILLAVTTIAGATSIGNVATGLEGVGLPAQVVDITPEKIEIQQHETTDFGATDQPDDDRVGTTDWRVVFGTGNCCENHLAASPDGRLFDIGGSYINFTDDRGETWKSVRPQTPLQNGEGSITMAPNGDILGIEWDAYTGDHLLAYKYDAAADEWLYLDNPIHHPVYDRPWISVVPGPFTVGPLGTEVPYVAIVEGGTGVKEPMFMSTDGLTYSEISSATIDGFNDTPVEGWFPIQADESFDWIQPIRRSPVTPLGGGYALDNSGALMDPGDRGWDDWTLPNGESPPTFVQIDSLGRIHHLQTVAGGFEYRISSDNGETWSATSVPLPIQLSMTDFHANAALGLAAVATRVNNQDWVYKFDISGDSARLIRRYRVGLGDAQAAPGVVQLTAPRFDFETVAILPDGKVAVSFLDASTLSHPPGTGILGRLTPVLAIETTTTFGDTGGEGADLSLTMSDSPDPVLVGEELTYTVEVTNNGPAPATGVTVVESLPSQARFESASDGCSEAEGLLTCALDTLEPGASTVTTLTVVPLEPGELESVASVSAVTVDPDDSNNSASETTTAECTVTGTSGDDKLKGTDERDVICGLGGDDQINGLDGDDLIFGGGGADKLNGNGGKDTIYGDAGDDDIKGGDGDDTLYGGDGFDSINGGAGVDSCSEGNDGATSKECET